MRTCFAFLRPRFVLPLFALIVLSGCATRRPISQGPPVQINRPSLNEISEAEIGEPILVHGKIYKRNGILLKTPLTKPGITAQPGFYTEVSEDGGWIYLANLENLAGTALCLSKTDNSDLRFPAFAPAANYHLKATNTANFDRGEIEQITQDAFKQELLYLGNRDGRAKFVYREVFGNAIRLPFSQDIDFDLKNDKSIRLKGANVEIIEATSTKLRYIVHTGFDDHLL